MCRLGGGAGSVNVPGTSTHRSISIPFSVGWVSGGLICLLAGMLIYFDRFIEKLIGRRWSVEGRNGICVHA